MPDLELLDPDDFEGLILLPGLEKAFVGLQYRFNMLEPIAVYDIDAVLQIYMERDEMDIDEAQEFFEYNTIGGWYGDRTPCFIKRGRV